MKPPPGGSFDVVVLGSGSAGLAAALAASSAGLSTLILEKTEFVGGTTAYSGAGTWIPANHHAAAAGVNDDAAEALAYIQAVAPPGWAETEEALWRSFVENGAKALRLIESHSPLRFELVPQRDPWPNAPGAKQFGRMLSPTLLRLGVLGSWGWRLRRSKLPQLFTYNEALRWGLPYASSRRWLSLAPRALFRLLLGYRGLGTALVAGLLKGCLDNLSEIRLNARAVSLDQDPQGRIRGVVVSTGDSQELIAAKYGVVIATGGFEWDSALLAEHFPGPIGYLASPRSNSGDGLKMAQAAGAALAHMDQANINSAIPCIYEGKPQGLGWFPHHGPASIVVNAAGRRFADERAASFGEALDQRDPQNGMPLNGSGWMIADARFLNRERLARWFARHDRNWIRKAPTIEALADRIGVPASTLAKEIADFNLLPARDETFPRPRQNAGEVPRHDWEPIDQPPFVAIPFNRSFMSTKGGPRTDSAARVLRADGSAIDGLYCAGVAMASPFGTRPFGAGTTIGPNLTWGYIAAMDILMRAGQTIQERRTPRKFENLSMAFAMTNPNCRSWHGPPLEK